MQFLMCLLKWQRMASFQIAEGLPVLGHKTCPIVDTKWQPSLLLTEEMKVAD